MVWKSTSSSGWEYLIVWEDLGLSSICVNWFIIFVIIYLWLFYFWEENELREWVVILSAQRNTHLPNFKQGFQVRGSCPCTFKLTDMCYDSGSLLFSINFFPCGYKILKVSKFFHILEKWFDNKWSIYSCIV